MLDRRELLKGAGLGAGALILGGVPVDPALARRVKRRNRVPFARGGNFRHGVSAGLPGTRTVSVWTRLGGASGDRRLTLEIARDPGFRRVVHRRTVTARASRDYTIEARVGGRYLRPGSEYYYRFATRRASSRVGRFRTRPPADSLAPVRIGFFSCQDWQAGYYGAHRALAAEDVDYVVCLGDYIYERNFYTGPRTDRLGANRDGEVETLPEYRSKYRLYRSDADLQAMHAAHPYMAVWDDHEVEDNYAGAAPGGATRDRRIPFLDRRANGYRAFYEYHPVDPIAGRPAKGDGLYRRVRLSRTAELFFLDERQFRDDQPCNDSLLALCPTADDPRRFLGRAQMEWLKRSLAGSDAAWKLVANQVMIMSLDVAPGQPLNKDAWDGYGAERRELLSFVRDRGIRDVAFLTGDIHTFLAGDVGVNGRGPGSVATEFVCGSVTSLGIPETVASATGAPLPPGVAEIVTRQIRVVNPHLVYDEQRARGYGIVEASAGALRVTLRGVNALVPGAPARTLARFEVTPGIPRVRRI